MVAGAKFSIDATEVTRAEYAAFLAVQPGMALQPLTVCSANTSYVPAANWPPTTSPQSPVTFVSWCDAAAYCNWAGKRLCGRIGGGPTPYSSYANASVSQWYAACSAGGTRTYPYASTYDPNACRGKDHGDTKPGDVGSLTTCEGGLPGLYDMSGNVWEWEDSCDSSDLCRRRGGAYGNTETILRCAVGGSDKRDVVARDLGFRCCKD
jgi:formylglycine-generating enzyme required for sulfatase activity